MLLITLSFTHIAHAKEKSVASAVRVVGDVRTVDTNNVSTTIALKSPLYSGDRLITGKNSWLTLNFYDLTRIVLRPDTELIINEFPVTMNAGDITLTLIQGGARITSGTIASQSIARFTVQTPNGDINVSRAEWVVILCNGSQCDNSAQQIKQCNRYTHPTTKNSQLISVYKGDIQLGYCPTKPTLHAGVSTFFYEQQSQEQSQQQSQQHQQCKTINHIPCFVLYDGKIGKDKLKAFKKKLIPLETDRPDSPHARPSSRTRRATTRIERSRRR